MQSDTPYEGNFLSPPVCGDAVVRRRLYEPPIHITNWRLCKKTRSGMGTFLKVLCFALQRSAADSEIRSAARFTAALQC